MLITYDLIAASARDSVHIISVVLGDKRCASHAFGLFYGRRQLAEEAEWTRLHARFIHMCIGALSVCVRVVPAAQHLIFVGALPQNENELNKWKNHLCEMKGDVGISRNENEKNKNMPTPRQSVIHNLIPPSLFLSRQHHLSCRQLDSLFLASFPYAFVKIHTHFLRCRVWVRILGTKCCLGCSYELSYICNK